MRIHTIDLNFLGTPGIIAAYLLECGSELALVETGPGSTLPVLQEGIRKLGFFPSEVRHVFLTHIHLDHAGGAGWWAQQGARLYCHPQAARHLVDPTRLIESARMVYKEQMDTLWGPMLPAPADRVIIVQDEETIQVGDASITALNTPGHARHHHAFVCGNVCFTGDVAGLRLEQKPYFSVTSAPPQFDPVAYVASIERLEKHQFESLYLTHFGQVTDPQAHLARYKQRIGEVHSKVRDWVKAGLDAALIREQFARSEQALAREAGVSAALWEHYEKGNGTAMCADGIRLYVEKNPG